MKRDLQNPIKITKNNKTKKHLCIFAIHLVDEVVKVQTGIIIKAGTEKYVYKNKAQAQI